MKTNGAIKIDKGIPLPPRAKYPFAEMQVGRVVPGAYAQRLRQARPELLEQETWASVQDAATA